MPRLKLDSDGGVISRKRESRKKRKRKLQMQKTPRKKVKEGYLKQQP